MAPILPCGIVSASIILVSTLFGPLSQEVSTTCTRNHFVHQVNKSKVKLLFISQMGEGPIVSHSCTVIKRESPLTF